MKKWSKLLAAALLGAMMLLAMSGCGNKTVTTIDKNAIYSQQDMDIQFPEGNVNSITAGNGKIYAYLSDWSKEPAEQMWCVCNIDGTDMQTYKLEADSNSWINQFEVDQQGNLVMILVEAKEDFSDPDNYSYTETYWLKKYAPDGSELLSQNLSEGGEFEYINRILFLNDGKTLIMAGNSLYLVDENFKTIKTKEMSDDTSINDIYTCKDGSLIVTAWGPDGQICKDFDINTLEFGEDFTMPVSTYNFSILQGQGYDLFLRDSTAIYGYNKGDKDITKVLDFIDSDLTTQYFDVFLPLSDTQFFATFYDYDSKESDDWGLKSVVLTKVKPEDVVEKQILSLGCVYLDSDIRRKVVEFNKTNPKYRITVKDYSIYNIEEDWEAGYKKMNTDIVSGLSPDIIVSDGTNAVQNYINKGLLLDLTSYLDNDTELNKADIFPSLLDAGSKDGKWYQLIPGFRIQTVVGKTSLLGDRTTWTISEMEAFEKTLQSEQKLFMDMSRANFMSMILATNSDTFIDQANGKCDFESAEFIDLLNYCKNLPEDTDEYWESLSKYYDNYESLWRENKIVLLPYSIGSMSDYNYMRQGRVGEEITFIGYPSASGNGSVMTFYSSFSISSKCSNADGAWEFIRQYLLPDYQETIEWQIPASMSQFDALAEKSKEKPSYIDEDGKKVEYDDTYYYNGQEIIIKPSTDADIKKVKDFIISVKGTMNGTSQIETIIDEEAAPFFAGQKSAEDVAKIIQSRATIYLTEQR